jgi:uncharacterized membrane protein YidH (DUF202 family)
VTDRGAQPQRTALAWQRTALAAAGCTLLLLHSAATHRWGTATVAPVVSGLTAIALAIAGGWRERHLRRARRPTAANALLMGGVSVMVVATAAASLLFRWNS